LSGVSFTDANNGTAVGFFGTILRTTNGGTTWTLQSNGTTEWLFGVSFTDANNGTAVGAEGRIFRTTNGGIYWASQSSGTTEWLRGVSFTDLNNGTAVGDLGTILRTTNGGTTWTSQSSGTSNGLRGVSFTDLNNGTAVGSGGTILRTTNGGVTFIGEEQIDELPTEFLLLQNYPNPFNPRTIINYSVPKQSNVTIIIYDALGREVTTLINEEKSIGNYTVEFSAKGGSASGGNATQLSSGVYFYQMRSDEFIQTKKMILLK
jgi:hypothetical protein